MLFEKKIENLAIFGNGENHCKNTEFENIVFNSKNVKKGDIFLPLKGDNHDAHKFIQEAYDMGAVCVISEKNLNNENYIHVENTSLFLENIARKQRELFRGLVIGITGSNGKTTTKETLSKYYENNLKEEEVYKSFGNYNNFFGLCFSLLDLNPFHKVGFFEIGTNNPGEISKLAEILKMDLSIVTNIGHAHLEGLKSIRGVASEKTDIFNFTHEKGFCFGNIPEDYLTLAKEKSIRKKSFFISNNDSKKLLKKVINTTNALLKLKSDSEQIDAFLAEKISIPGRFEIKKSRSKALIIDDAYNANPDSFKYAFHKIQNLDLSKILSEDVKDKYRRKICVFGKMGELGDKSEELHKNILEEASSIFDLVFVIDLKMDLKSSNVRFLKREKIESSLKEYLNEDSLIFFKGSRSVKMENIINNLI